MKKIILFIIILLALISAFVYRIKIKDVWSDLTKPPLPEAVEYNEQKKQLTNNEQRAIVDNQNNSLNSASTTPNITLPKSFNLNVPFTSQAPLADWNETFKEACEETAALIVHYYYQNKTFAPQTATEEILKMVDWQEKNWGGHYDLTASQTAALIKNYFGYKKVEIINNPTVDDIKYHISEKRPVIVPAAGQLLGNPYFRTPGPIYHMLVINGYIDDKFITNDPGTKRGENFLYDDDTIMDAMHDFDSDDILKGKKRIIVIYPK